MMQLIGSIKKIITALVNEFVNSIRNANGSGPNAAEPIETVVAAPRMLPKLPLP